MATLNVALKVGAAVAVNAAPSTGQNGVLDTTHYTVPANSYVILNAIAFNATSTAGISGSAQNCELYIGGIQVAIGTTVTAFTQGQQIILGPGQTIRTILRGGTGSLGSASGVVKFNGVQLSNTQ